MITINDYEKLAEAIGYNEEDTFIGPAKEKLMDFINYEKACIELKIYLCELIIYRHFMPVGIIVNNEDVHWFIEKYFSTYQFDYVQLERATPIKEAKELIMAGDPFGKTTVGTFFMFAIIEFYAKYKLGFRPNHYNATDFTKHDYAKHFDRKIKSKQVYLSEALVILEELNFPISYSLKKLNSKTINKMNELCLIEKGSVRFKVADRLIVARNDMLHGEKFCYFDRGRYMLLLYILFQLNEELERKK